jgi:putative copper export protein
VGAADENAIWIGVDSPWCRFRSARDRSADRTSKPGCQIVGDRSKLGAQRLARVVGSRRGGDLHLTADILHLLASGIWLGGLLPFVLLLATLPNAAAEITHRFSSLATISVLILLPSGIVNGWMILGSIAALLGTLYGELLLGKIALFLLMLVFAGVNRFVLTPQLAMKDQPERARAHLIIHSGCEIALGLAILVIVGVLGTLTPMEEHAQQHR